MIGNPIQQKDITVERDFIHIIKFDYVLGTSQHKVIHDFILQNEKTIRALVELERLHLLELGQDILALNKKLYNK